MSVFYIDDSVHDQAGFVIGACVYTHTDVNHELTALFKAYGFDDPDFEFKSSAIYSGKTELKYLRISLKQIVQRYCQFGLVILPREKRADLGAECLMAIQQFVNANKLNNETLSVYMDQGMFKSLYQAECLIKKLELNALTLYAEQNSRVIKGLQLADLVAHMVAIQLKITMGYPNKLVKALSDSGYEQDAEMELSFEMFASLRHSLFRSDQNIGDNNSIEQATYDVGKNGLYISNHCSEELKQHAQATFGSVYLGCIH